MNTLYKFSPLIVFIIAYFIWSDSPHNAPFVLAMNGVIILAVVMILAFIPAIAIYLKGNQQRVVTNPEDSLDDFKIRTKKVSFYFLFSRLVFYIGVGMCLLIVILKLS